MAAPSAVSIEGFRDLSRAFALAEKEVRVEFRATLRKAAEPVKVDATELARGEISGIGRALGKGGPDWSGMRVGVTRSLVYVAPKQKGVNARGTGGKRRPNLASRLRDDAMQPALEKNIDGIEHEVERMLNGIAADWQRV